MITPDKSLLEALDISELLPEEQEELLLDLQETIFKGSLIRLIEMMDEPTKEEFNTLLETDPEEDTMMAFLTERVPNAEQAVADTVKELTDDILAVTGGSQD